MSVVVRYYPGGYDPVAAQHNMAEQWDGAAQTYTAWDSQGVQTSSRAFTAAESAQNTAMDTASTASGNQAGLLGKAQNALTSNATYLAIGSPTTGQAVAQVASLTKQVNALIRLLLQQFDSVSGT